MLDVIYHQLPYSFSYFTFACRLSAFILFAPFGLCIILDIIAYVFFRFPVYLALTDGLGQSIPINHFTPLHEGFVHDADNLLSLSHLAIARTLHLSITQRRVPRSPPVLSKEILSNDLNSSSGEVSEEESISDS
uniref:Uncharacterized protein n=1 Tax=Kwoniella pini CBS 10737 TaxID=1296096 RepID=A0A1B9HX56_9TREE|nr:uncharacterized protein I206_05717 [Kwoniella pini CBS 10737]OCF47857.1 hypothetical protein I206_05717 [Kwoniella pini CBS 10737]